MRLTITVHQYFALPDDVRAEFDAWIEAEGLDDKLIVELTVGEGQVAVKRYDRDADGNYRLRLGEHGRELVVVDDVFPVRTLPPRSVFSGAVAS